MRIQSTPLTPEGKRKFNKLFAALRKARVLARQNFACCQNCALAALDVELVQDPTLRGYAFYSRQDGAGLHEAGGTFIAFGIHADADGDAILEAEVRFVASIIIEAARDAELWAEWGGNTRTRIWVTEHSPST